MERIRISILEKFSLIVAVMSYYGYTHRWFLLLSTISKKIRLSLIENYEAFRRTMLNNSLIKDAYGDNLAVLVHLPADLFKFNIVWADTKNLIAVANTV